MSNTAWKLRTEFEVIDAALQATLSAGLIPRYEFRRDQITNASAKYSLILAYLEEPEEHEDIWGIGSIRIEVDIRKLGKELAELRVSDPILYTTSDDSHAGETPQEWEWWETKRDRAVEYIIEGLKRDDAWNPQAIDHRPQESVQPTDVIAPIDGFITRILPAFDCVVPAFFTWLMHYTSDVMLRRFPAERGYFRINPDPIKWPSQDKIHAIAFIEWGGQRGFDTDDETGLQEIECPLWLIRLDIIYVPRHRGEERITIKAQCSELAVRAYFDELLQAIINTWIKSSDVSNRPDTGDRDATSQQSAQTSVGNGQGLPAQTERKAILDAIDRANKKARGLVPKWKLIRDELSYTDPTDDKEAPSVPTLRSKIRAMWNDETARDEIKVRGLDDVIEALATRKRK